MLEFSNSDDICITMTLEQPAYKQRFYLKPVPALKLSGARLNVGEASQSINIIIEQIKALGGLG